MKLLIPIITTIALCLAINAKAQTIVDVEIFDAKIFNDKALVAQGVGVRSKFFIDLYTASFFNEETNSYKEPKATDTKQVLNSQNLSAIDLILFLV